MKSAWIFLVATVIAAPAHAQIKCWTGADGKRACGDTPPPGAKVTTVKTPSGPSAPAPSAKDGAAKDAAAKDAKKGPLTPAEQEQEYRKRQAEAQKAREKAAQAEQEAAARKENCQRAQESLRTLQGGQRIARVDAQGERYYLDDQQLAQEAAKAQELVRQWCN
jgi:hypothetical protein